MTNLYFFTYDPIMPFVFSSTTYYPNSFSMKQMLLILCSLLLFASCQQDNKSKLGYKPIYSQNGEEKIITNDRENKIINKPGKNTVVNNTFYIVDEGKGIQVYDVSNPESPMSVNFIHVYGIKEMSARGNYLYVNCVNDLVVLDVSDRTNAVVVNRFENEFHTLNTTRPPEAGIFECIDPTKGAVIGWEKTNLKNANCRL